METVLSIEFLPFFLSILVPKNRTVPNFLIYLDPLFGGQVNAPELMFFGVFDDGVFSRAPELRRVIGGKRKPDSLLFCQIRVQETDGRNFLFEFPQDEPPIRRQLQSL